MNRLWLPALVAVVLGLAGAHAVAQNVGSSLLLLIDASGSMGDPVGSGNPQSKIAAAKSAATAALGQAAKSGSVEVAVLAFSGDCADPVPRYQDFTRDVGRLTAFIASLQPGGGTPMADALLFANRFMDRNGRAGARDRMIMLLADGHNDCGDVDQALATLQASGIIFRHETVGFGITPTSPAAADLRRVATQTGGTYHHAADAAQLADVFMEFVDTFSVIDLLGQFGRSAQPSPRPAPQATDTQAQGEDDGLTGLLGGFKAPARDAAPQPTPHEATGDARPLPCGGDVTAGGLAHRTGRTRLLRLRLAHRSRATTRGWPPRPSAAGRAVAACATSTPAALRCAADALGSPWRVGATVTRTRSGPTW